MIHNCQTHLDPPPSRGRKVGKNSLNRDCFVALLLAMTEEDAPRNDIHRRACPTLYILLD